MSKRNLNNWTEFYDSCFHGFEKEVIMYVTTNGSGNHTISSSIINFFLIFVCKWICLKSHELISKRINMRSFKLFWSEVAFVVKYHNGFKIYASRTKRIGRRAGIYLHLILSDVTSMCCVSLQFLLFDTKMHLYRIRSM